MENIIKGSVFYADLGNSLGSEQHGKRPVVVVQNDLGNTYSPTTVVVPISKQHKNFLPTHIFLKKNDFIHFDSVILVEQIRVVDKSRLLKFLGILSFDKIKEIDNSIAIEFGINGGVYERLYCDYHKNTKN